jgi:hypothetical protein
MEEKMYPDWVNKQKKKGTNISCINGRYYLYAVSSVWNKEKGRAQKITKEYLGRITEEGLIPPKHKTQKVEMPITVKEYGASNVLNTIGADILTELRKSFPVYGEHIFAISALRVIEQCPFKRIEHYYKNSYLSELYKGLNLSGKDISELLKNFGGDREEMVKFMRQFIEGNEHILFDLNDVTVYLDAELRNQEEKRYLQNIEKEVEGYTMKGYIENQYKFGTIALKSNVSKPAQEIYNLYKERCEIEQSFDFLKNLFNQDRSFMQNARSLETWAFINHISLMLSYKIYNLLREQKLLSKYSVSDLLSHLKYIFKVKINNGWYLSETTKKTRQMLDTLKLNIT